MDDIKCSKCGAVIQAPPDAIPLYMVSETELRALIALFTREIDQNLCLACKTPLEASISTAVVFRQPRATYAVFGSSITKSEQAKFRKFLRDKFRAKPELFASLDELRLAVGKRLKKRLQASPIFEEVFEAMLQGEMETVEQVLRKNWRTLTPEVFAALFIALMKPPGVGIDLLRSTGERVPPKTLVNLIAGLQAMSWLTLASEWGEEANISASSLEADLQRFVDPGVILPGALEFAFEGMDRLEGNPAEMAFAVGYAIAAVRASLCAVAKQANLKAGLWTEYFFAYELAYRTAGKDIPAKFSKLTIAPERSQKTITFENAWDTIGRWLQEWMNDGTFLDKLKSEQWLRLQEISAKVDYPDLTSQILINAYKSKFRRLKSISVELLITTFQNSLSESYTLDEAIEAAILYGESLVQPERVEDLNHYCDRLLDLVNNSDEFQARLEVWLGSVLKDLRQPRMFLERIGESPRDWEDELDPSTCARLWLERSNAMRLLGKLDQALQIVGEIIPRFNSALHENHRFVVYQNAAILLRETGSPDRAVVILKQLVVDVVEKHHKIYILHSLAVTYIELNQYSEALQCLDEGIQMAKGLRSDSACRLKATRALILTTQDKFAEAIPILEEIAVEKPKDCMAALAEISAWLNIIIDQPSLVSSDRCEQISHDLSTLIQTSLTTRDIQTYLGSLCLNAFFYLRANLPNTTELFQQAYQAYEKYDQPQDILILIFLGKIAYETGEVEQARKYLSEIPRSFTKQLGGTTDLALVVNGPKRLQPAFNQLMLSVFNSETRTLEDMRLVAELQRDVIRRACLFRKQSSLSTNTINLYDGLSDAGIRQLAPTQGNLGVLEWIVIGDYWCGCLLTKITSEAEVTTHWLNKIDLSLPSLGRIRTRLKNWLPCTPGDPFDEDEWQQVETWLIQALSQHLVEGDHIVFIEHEEYSGIPWHVAVASRWTSSYIASWTALLTLPHHTSRKDWKTVGIALVPRFNETTEVHAALETSAQYTQSLCEELKLCSVIREEQACDRDAFKTLMEESDILKLLCHGYIDENRDIVLLLAHKGVLPLETAAASDSKLGRLHHFSWRELQSVSTTPDVIFSAACSSGVSKIAGLGEKLGLFNALRNGGTRAMIAPLWDIVAAAVLPILDETCDRYLKEGVPLAQAWHVSCSHAAMTQPRWIAWALTIEGDWR